MNQQIATRTCSACKKDLAEDADHFYRHPSGGFRSICKSCLKEKDRLYRREKAKQREDAHPRAGPLSARERCHHHYVKYRDRYLEKHRQYREENREEIRNKARVDPEKERMDMMAVIRDFRQHETSK